MKTNQLNLLSYVQIIWGSCYCELLILRFTNKSTNSFEIHAQALGSAIHHNPFYKH